MPLAVVAEPRELTQNTARRQQAARSTSPTNMPQPAIWFVPSQLLPLSMDPPTACSTRQPISHSAARLPWNGSNDSRIEAAVKTTKPEL